MKNVLILLIITYIILFHPIVINIKYEKNDALLIRMRILEIIEIPLKFIIKYDFDIEKIRKFLFSIKNESINDFKEIRNFYKLLKDILSSTVINDLKINLYTNQALMVSSFYFLINLLDIILNDFLYMVHNTLYNVSYSEENKIKVMCTVKIKLWKLVVHFVKNLSSIKYLIKRRNAYGKSN